MNKRKSKYSLVLSVASAFLLVVSARVDADVKRVKYQAEGNYLIVEVLDDDLIHFEYGAGDGPGTSAPIETSDMICSADDGVPAAVCEPDFSGPTQFSNDGAGILDTKEIRISVDQNILAVSLIDKTKNNLVLTTLKPQNLGQDLKAMMGTHGKELDVYGLGQQFVDPGNADIDWEGRVREGSSFGNVMAGFNGGANGNTQMPVMYAVNGASFENYALLLDNTYRQKWDFTSPSQWKVEVSRGKLRFYFMTGADLLDLRKDYMELVGHPLVPPKKMFGLWMSEYGYDNWGELENKLRTLRDNKFPLDGFVLDLQWFGGIIPNSDDTKMGCLTFDETNFPNPKATIDRYQDQEGVGIMLIEEAYVGRNCPFHTAMHERGCLATDRPGGTEPAYITSNPWWGKGGMFDYTNDDCGKYVHDAKRQALIDKGVIGHWTDLGEPEMFNAGSGYSVGDHATAHNIFNFRWIRSIHTGYKRHDVDRRPFMMSRSGTAGIQRFGAAMWSGDIGSKLDNVESHAANQKHMSFSGIDYYGSDIGGFHRGDIQHDVPRKNEMYTQWYAASMMFDIPGRPHTENLCNCKETAPDRLGDLQSNRENTRLRYSLIPYVYSLAHRAYLYGEPVMPALVMFYQTDDNVRNVGREKMIGRDLLAAVFAEHGERKGDVYLPAGTWFEWHNGYRKIVSQGNISYRSDLYHNDMFRVPLFARAGAVIPMAYVDEKTMNSEGKRKDGHIRNELIAKVFDFGPEQNQEGSFTLYEDDGMTVAYQKGAVRKTKITNAAITEEGNPDRYTVKVGVLKSEGSYDGAPASRNNVVRLVTDGEVPKGKKVTLNGTELKKFINKEDFEGADSGWWQGGNEVIAKSGVKKVSEGKTFVFPLKRGEPCTSTSRYLAVPGAGNDWNPADPTRRLTKCVGTVWSTETPIALCAEKYKFAADGSWEKNWGCDGKQGGANCPPRLDAPGLYQVSFDENKPANPAFMRIGDATCPSKSKFVCKNGHTTFATSVYVVGNVTKLGEWNPCDAVKLEPNGPYPKWTGEIDVPADTPIEWKCIKRREESCDVVQWESDPNNVFDAQQAEQVGTF